MDKDKLEELNRYDSRAEDQLSSGFCSSKLGALGFRGYLRAPYRYYENYITKYLKAGTDVLELGSGVGQHTDVLLSAGLNVTASDISPNSLAVLKRRIDRKGKSIEIQVADIEDLPFGDNQFDIVVCAGSLSYGDPVKVDAEFKRVLKPLGTVVFVDSLNHNPIYRLNRWLHYRRGQRSKNTLVRMPTVDRIYQISKDFDYVDVKYFGCATFIMPLVSRFFGEVFAENLSEYLDKFFKCKKSAFKFVMVARDFRKLE